MELIDMLAEEKMQRQEEEEKLKKHLMVLRTFIFLYENLIKMFHFKSNLFIY